jgi:hypothetical protein
MPSFCKKNAFFLQKTTFRKIGLFPKVVEWAKKQRKPLTL